MSRSPAGTAIKILRGGYVVALVVAVIPYGGVYSQLIALALVPFAVIAVACAALPLRPELQAPALWATGLVGLLAAWAALQGTSLLGVNPAWTDAVDVLGPGVGAFSVAPHMGFLGLANLILPGMAFVAGLVLFQDDEGAMLLFRVTALLALAGALLGLYEYVASPTQLLFRPRIYTMDGVTAFFVNRNTAATFLGLGALLWWSLLLNRLKEEGLSGLKSILIENDARHRRTAIRLLGLTLCFLAVLVALFLTKSRAGISASLAGLMVTTIAVLWSSRRRTSGFARLAPLAAAAGFVLAIVTLYGSPFLNRVSATDASGDLRWCFFRDMAAAIQASPLGGTGYGTLSLAYPKYRNPACMSLDLALDRGHNGYLELALGLGLPALLVLLAGIVVLSLTLASGVTTRHRLRLAPAAALGALALVVIHSGLDFSLQIPGVAVFTASILAFGVTAALPSSRRRRRSHGHNVPQTAA